jgi:hypothetical protein
VLTPEPKNLTPRCPATDAVYRAGCTLFDGRQFIHYNMGDMALSKFRQVWGSRWPAKRGLLGGLRLTKESV